MSYLLRLTVGAVAMAVALGLTSLSMARPPQGLLWFTGITGFISAVLVTILVSNWASEEVPSDAEVL